MGFEQHCSTQPRDFQGRDFLVLMYRESCMPVRALRQRQLRNKWLYRWTPPPPFLGKGSACSFWWDTENKSALALFYLLPPFENKNKPQIYTGYWKKPTLLAPRGLSCPAWRLLVTAGGADRRGLRTPLSQTREKKNNNPWGGLTAVLGGLGRPYELPWTPAKRVPAGEAVAGGPGRPGLAWDSAERDPLRLQPPRGRQLAGGADPRSPLKDTGRAPRFPPGLRHPDSGSREKPSAPGSKRRPPSGLPFPTPRPPRVR